MISRIGATSRRKYTQSDRISPMWKGKYSLSYQVVLKRRPVFLLPETLLAGSSQQPQVKLVVK
jgi:hypothetical protein